MTTIYTLGHSRHPIDHFASLLATHAIAAVVDVRSHPYSRWAPHFEKKRLSRSLEQAGIGYVYLGGALGGRPAGEEFYDARGRLDHARRASAADFQAGIEGLLELALRQPTAVMCAEENPDRCHRRLLLTPALVERGVSVVHIRGDGRVRSEPELTGSSPQLELFRP